ncbi:MAG: HEAT repeat domain-containing protein [Methanobacteriota archaeon]
MVNNPAIISLESFTWKTPEEYRIKKSIRNLDCPFPDLVDDAKVLLKRTGKKAIPYILEAIESRVFEGDTIRYELPEVFALFGKDSVPVLIPLLAGADETADADDDNDDDEGDIDYGYVLQYAAESALQEIGKTGVPLLCKGMSDTNPVIRSKIASILGEISDKRAVPALVQALADPDNDVRSEAVQALIAIGSPSYDKVLPLLRDPSIDLQIAAITILPEVNREKGIAAIVPFFEDSREEVWDAVYDSLTEMESKPISEMIAYLDCGKKEVIIGVLNILVNVGDRTLIPIITPFTRDVDEEIRNVADWSIEELSKEKMPPKITTIVV